MINTDYYGFLRWLYANNPGLDKMSYEEQMRVRVESLFGVADFYSSNLRSLGHEAFEVHANNEPMQKAWAQEHDIGQMRTPPTEVVLQLVRNVSARTPLVHLPGFLRPKLGHFASCPSWFYEILSEQIKYYKPDVLLNQDLASIPCRFLRRMKPFVRLLVGQYASAVPEEADLHCYDLIVSPLPDVVASLNRIGISAGLLKLGFEPRVLGFLEDTVANVPVSFVGSLSRVHTSRIRFLEHLCARLSVDVWGEISAVLPPDSTIRGCYRGQAWGVDMYRILRASKITLNQSIFPYATNMRLFEATGVGTLLITDFKMNLNEVFEPGKEVVAYCSPEECVELVQYYLEHEKEREAIARAGQKRTLREHTYRHRMKELVAIIERYS
jgi:glycosyltransferase involved in cell wall biosynthesis